MRFNQIIIMLFLVGAANSQTVRNRDQADNCEEHCSWWDEKPIKQPDNQCWCLSVVGTDKKCDKSHKENTHNINGAWARGDQCIIKNKKCLCRAYPPPGVPWICSETCPDGIASCGWGTACPAYHSLKQLRAAKKLSNKINQTNKENHRKAKAEYCAKDPNFYDCLGTK